MLSVSIKILSVTFLTVGGALLYRYPEQSVVLLLGIGLTALSVFIRYRNRRTLNKVDKTT